MEKTDVQTTGNDSSENPEYKYFLGKRYVKNPETGKFAPLSTKPKNGRYGMETVSIRVPVLLIPYIRAILAKCEEIESVRNCILQNVLHTTPNFNPYSFDPLADAMFADEFEEDAEV